MLGWPISAEDKKYCDQILEMKKTMEDIKRLEKRLENLDPSVELSTESDLFYIKETKKIGNDIIIEKEYSKKLASCRLKIIYQNINHSSVYWTCCNCYDPYHDIVNHKALEDFNSLYNFK
jgi:tetrahydromethanopterin S-methyltransferase subunit G